MSNNLCVKILVLKMCRNRSLAHAGTDKENALEIAMSVLKMLAAPLGHGGSFISESGEDPKVMSRMRLQAAVSLLHLFTIPIYSKTIAPLFFEAHACRAGTITVSRDDSCIMRCVGCVQDTCFDVQMAFLKELVTLSHPQKTTRDLICPGRYAEVPPSETDPAHVDDVHPPAAFVGAPSGFRNLPGRGAQYRQFYLSQVANADTISLLYHLAIKGKTVWDVESQQHTELRVAHS
ncbi:hypothetical protein B0H14DRAFT_3474818 [Mycena olivaceomarginata]|nr:hypothetical protein B0H14DRAFT_3474818 [Mycena olivaceomarginata]